MLAHSALISQLLVSTIAKIRAHLPLKEGLANPGRQKEVCVLVAVCHKESSGQRKVVIRSIGKQRLQFSGRVVEGHDVGDSHSRLQAGPGFKLWTTLAEFDGLCDHSWAYIVLVAQLDVPVVGSSSHIDLRLPLGPDGEGFERVDVRWLAFH